MGDRKTSRTMALLRIGSNLYIKKLAKKTRSPTVASIPMTCGRTLGPSYHKPELEVPSAWNEAKEKCGDTRSV